MRKLLIIGLFVSFIACSGTKDSAKAPKPTITDFVETITAEGLRRDLEVIAHDSLEGRDTGSPGLEKAARYLSGRYTELGLEPVGDNGTYEQFFDVVAPVTNSYDYTVKDVNGNVIDNSKLTKNEIGNFSNIFGNNADVEGEILFAGTGTVNNKLDINHFPEDMGGKWVMIFSAEDTNLRTLQQTVFSSGALGLILIPETVEDFKATAEGRQFSIGTPGRMTLAYMSNNNSGRGGGSQPSYEVINPELAAQILSVNNADELHTLSKTIQDNPADFTPSNTGFTFSYKVDAEEKTITTSNIVAFLEGSDPKLKEEVVVLSSHYDHIGITAPDSTGDTINNGADDDGSGTVGVLHAAQAMAAAKNAGVGPKRSVLFMHVAGEEKGLLGSRYYSDHPIYEIENTVANINVDMIGRVDEIHKDRKDFIYIIGGKLISSGLDSIVREANEKSVNINISERFNDLNDPNQFYRRSDHWNFGRLGIPFIFFFNGVHDDYHRPSDEIKYIEWEQLTQRTKLLYMSTALIANAKDRPVVDNQAFIEATQVQPR